MRLSLCEHLKIGGGRCGSPAMRGQRYCYYHAGAHRELPPADLLAALRCPGHEKDFRVREHHHPVASAMVQRGFLQLVHAIIHNEIDARRAKLMLASLHRVTQNVSSVEEGESVAAEAIARSARAQGHALGAVPQGTRDSLMPRDPGFTSLCENPVAATRLGRISTSTRSLRPGLTSLTPLRGWTDAFGQHWSHRRPLSQVRTLTHTSWATFVSGSALTPAHFARTVRPHFLATSEELQAKSAPLVGPGSNSRETIRRHRI